MIKKFLNFVEIRTKITTTFPFIMCMVYLVYLKQPINWMLSIIFFASMFIIDLTTTAINNYIDSKPDYRELSISPKAAKAIIIIMFCISAGLGIWLWLLTDLFVLLLGGLCFLCGVFYTWGPVPISRQPLGEIMSGVFQGIFGPFLILYLNLPKGSLLTFSLSLQTLDFSLNLWQMVVILLLCAAPACATANIMLANNICDLEKDITVKRYTLPYYLGKHALTLFKILAVIPYFAALILVFTKVFPGIYLLSLITAPVVLRNVTLFCEKQEKSATFALSIQNYILLMSGNIILTFISSLEKLPF